MKRKEFLVDFLGALGAEKVEWHKEEGSIFGRVIYKLDDPEEIQDFCWHISESNVPRKEVKNLVSLLKYQNLLSIDRIILTIPELLARYNIEYNLALSLTQFQDILGELENIEVPMMDEGKETDAYFIHQ